MARFLQTSDIHTLVRRVGPNALLDELIEALEDALQSYSPEDVQTVPRDGFVHGNGLLEWMPASRKDGRTVLKMVGYQPLNPSRHEMPTILATVGLYDAGTGRMEFLMDGTLMTAMRTGAASAVASRILASRCSETLGLIGCGCQAVTQLQALSRIFPLKRVLAFDVEPGQAERFAARMRELDLCQIPIEASRLEQVVASSDVICVATSSEVGAPPVIGMDMSHKPWLHINAVGADFVGKVELSKDLLGSAFVCPDFLPQARLEGECQQLNAGQIGPDLATLVQNPEMHPSPQGLTVFDSTGWALEDLVAAEIFLAHAERLGLGQEFDLEGGRHEPKDPYRFLETHLCV